MNRLVIYRGDELLAEHELARAVIGLGRHPENDIVLDDRTLSRFHARIEKRADTYVVVDLGAQNGVHKNGERIEKESELASGDRIELGRYVAVFEIVAKKEKAKPANGHGVNGSVNGNGANGHGVNGHARNGKKPEIDIDVDLDVDLDLDLGLDEDDDLAFDPDTDARTRSGKEDDKTGNVSDFDGGASSVEYQPPKPTFVVLFNGLEVSRHPLTETGISVGRSKQCEIVISLLGLSRKHAKIYASDDGVVVEDLGSQNGTWVNNQRIEGSRVLRHGDLMNFYDYGVLFLEDADVEVGFPGADFSPPPSTEQRGGGRDDLSAQETNQAPGPITTGPRPRAPTTRSPLIDVGPAAVPPAGEETEMGRGRPATKKKRPSPLDDDDEDDSRLDLDDLGEGSFLGDEFEDGASKDRVKPTSKPASGAIGTELIEGVDLSRGAGDEDLEAEIAFAAASAGAGGEEADEFSGGNPTNGDMGKLADRTTAGFDVQGLGGAWPGDDELERVLSQANDTMTVTLDVTLKGKPYAQIPLSQAITRLGADARCEVALPKSAGLRPWHCTLLDMGGAVVVQRTNRGAIVEVGGKDIDVAVLKNNDVVKMGNVEIKLRFRK
ncbi:MAG: FHA domain-containing protein [Deltaproteobacteria bacterium]|nr:FHA domain-containing protein [Deltaproteobacteria bacterium]